MCGIISSRLMTGRIYLKETKMSRYTFSTLKGNSPRALDGDIGSIRDLFFEDSGWEVRYLVVDTGNWLPGRKVLLSPSALRDPDWASGTLPVNLTQEQIKNSPNIDTDKPVSLQMQEELSSYYGWPALPTYPYWPIGGAYVPPPAPNMATFPIPTEPPPGEPQLRSCREIIGYSIEGRDGEIGEVDDLIINTTDWRISLIVVDTGTWLTGRKVLLSPTEVTKISWSNNSLLVNLIREQIQGSPEYDSETLVDAEYEKRLVEYYGKPPFGP
jgi:uncharacterized protein YrrD